MTAWHEKGISSSIYSSGSVFAQKLLFAHIRDPSCEDVKAIIDRKDLIQMWFDTTNAGPKTERGSYETIARSLRGKRGAEAEAEAGTVLFLSDNVREVRAALEAGMKAIVVDRPGNAELLGCEREEYEVVTSFEQIRLG